MTNHVTNHLNTAFCGAFAAALIAIFPHTATAQSSTAREVVQPLPSSQVQRLNRALLEIARKPRSVSALLEAGDASLDVGDLDAAIGFYERAAELGPSDARVKLGMAQVYLRSGRPVEALPLLQDAENVGARPSDVISARALAYDMVGDQVAAQSAYLKALELTPQSDELRQRFAISQAISGNATGFQETLAPLIEARNVAGFRTRAFGLAILGEQERAEGIVNSIMPRDLSARINPYLAYMPRLTPAQQAAAANLGIFPRAADIGREDPRIARFAQEGKTAALLEPAGEPLGASPGTTAQTPPTIVEEVAVQTTPPIREQAQPEPTPPTSEASLPQVATREVEPDPPAQMQPQTQLQPQPEPAPAVITTPPASVADAFADLDNAELPVTASGPDAVDIAALDVPREAQIQPEPEPEPAKPEHPRRIWVQLATGRDVKALGFDWRRFSRRAPELLDGFKPHVTPWGQANRLLAGPVENASEARALVNALGEEGIETFSYTSPQGTEIKELK